MSIGAMGIVGSTLKSMNFKRSSQLSSPFSFLSRLLKKSTIIYNEELFQLIKNNLHSLIQHGMQQFDVNGDPASPQNRVQGGSRQISSLIAVKVMQVFRKAIQIIP